MIKAVIADVDGVIVGKKQGVNFPLPSEQVIQRLKAVHNNGVPLVLCTAKFNYAVRKIVERAELRNPHITDGGALIIDPLDNQTIKKRTLDRQLTRNIVLACLENNLYTEVYEPENYYVQKGQVNTFTQKRLAVLQKRHKAVDSLVEQLPHLEIIKIITFAKDVEDKKRVERIFQPFMPQINFLWTMHPAHLPFQAAIITVKGVSKKHAAKEVLEYLKISPVDTLGIGDTLGDWNFMSECGYVATVGDESQELKDLARTKGEESYYFASSVNDNGILDIFDRFGL